jgi:hypothetical protein
MGDVTELATIEIHYFLQPLLLDFASLLFF